MLAAAAVDTWNFESDEILIAGSYNGSLEEKERLELVAPINREIHEFSYDTRWFAFGQTFSIVPVVESHSVEDWSSRFAWRPTGLAAGSPGSEDPAVYGSVVINEIMSRTRLSA